MEIQTMCPPSGLIPKVGDQGSLVAVPNSPFQTGRIPDSVAVDRTSRFAYVTSADEEGLGLWLSDL
jgi:hypothetical protein